MFVSTEENNRPQSLPFVRPVQILIYWKLGHEGGKMILALIFHSLALALATHSIPTGSTAPNPVFLSGDLMD